MYAVFGATGRVGGAAARALTRRGLPVRAVTRVPAAARRNVPGALEIVAADLHDESSVRRAIEGARGVLLVCPLDGSAADVAADAHRIIESAAGALEAVKPSLVVAVSDYGAEQTSGTGVAGIFHHLEMRLRTAGVAVTFLRSAEHMENWARYERVARHRGVLSSMHHPIDRPFPMVSARDVGAEAARLFVDEEQEMARPGGVVHVEGPCRYSVLDVAATLGGVLSRSVVAEESPRRLWVTRLVAAGASESYARLVVEWEEAHGAGRIDVERSAGDVRRGQTTLSEALIEALGPGDSAHPSSSGDAP